MTKKNQERNENQHTVVQENLCEKCGEREFHHVHLKDEFKEEVTSKDHRLVYKKHPEYFEKLCTQCHSEIHGNVPKQSELKRLVIFRDRAIKRKNVIENHIRGFGRIEYKIPETLEDDYKRIKKEIRELEKQIKKHLEEEYAGEFLDWLLNIKGVSHVSASKLLAYVDINNTPSISALWSYCGLNPNFVKRKRGMTQEEAMKCGNPYLKKEMMGIQADSFIRQRTPIYREIYDESKDKYAKLEFEPGELKEKFNGYKKKSVGLSKGHIHNRAKRKMVKTFLKHFWLKWRKFEKLPLSKPFK